MDRLMGVAVPHWPGLQIGDNIETCAGVLLLALHLLPRPSSTGLSISGYSVSKALAIMLLE